MVKAIVRTWHLNQSRDLVLTTNNKQLETGMFDYEHIEPAMLDCEDSIVYQ